MHMLRGCKVSLLLTVACLPPLPDVLERELNVDLVKIRG
jgi:hypothetical protein